MPTFGYPSGTRNQNRPIVFVDHIMAGWKATLDNGAWRLANQVGVTFGIGRDGSLSQYCSIFDAHWGNGVSGDKLRYDRTNPRLAALEAQGTWIAVPYAGTTAHALVKNGVNVLNSGSIATEHEGFPGDVWTQAMTETSIESKRWAIKELRDSGFNMPVDDFVIVRHAQIDPRNRPNCPGSGWPKATIIAELEGEVTADEVRQIIREELAYIVAVCTALDKGNLGYMYQPYVGSPLNNGAKTLPQVIADLLAERAKA